MEYDKLEYLEHVHRHDRKIINFVTLLSVIYFIFIILELYFEKFSSALDTLVVIDTVICFIFLMESFYFLGRARGKWEYFRKYSLDFLSSIPLLFLIWIWPELLFLSLFKILRGVKGILKMYDFMIENGKRRKVA